MPRNLSEDLNNPDLFNENSQGAYEYGELNNGARYASGSLKLAEEPERNSKAQRQAGGDLRRPADHEWGADDGGHLVGARFGGESGKDNLVAQDRNLNRGTYKRMENEWAEHLDNGDKVFVNIETSEPDRPNAFMGYAIYEHADGTRDYDTFHYVNENRDEIAQWEEDALALEAEDYNEYIGAEETAGEQAEVAEANEYLGPEMAANTSPEQEDINECVDALDEVAESGQEASGGASHDNSADNSLEM